MAGTRAGRKRSGKPSGSFRIIGGRWRGKRLSFPDSEGLRPTPDRVRETLFNWLQGRVAGARVLDLYAGTGAVGLEALSRGAAELVAVERAPALVGRLREHLDGLAVEAATVIRAELPDGLRELSGRFELIFLDPPFRSDVVRGLLERISEQGLLAPGGLVYLETERELDPGSLGAWAVFREGHAGQVGFRLLEPEAVDEAQETPP